MKPSSRGHQPSPGVINKVHNLSRFSLHLGSHLSLWKQLPGRKLLLQTLRPHQRFWGLSTKLCNVTGSTRSVGISVHLGVGVGWGGAGLLLNRGDPSCVPCGSFIEQLSLSLHLCCCCCLGEVLSLPRTSSHNTLCLCQRECLCANQFLEWVLTGMYLSLLLSP